MIEAVTTTAINNSSSSSSSTAGVFIVIVITVDIRKFPERATRLKEKPQLTESALRLYFLGLEGKAYMPSPSSLSDGPVLGWTNRRRRRGWHVGLAFKT